MDNRAESILKTLLYFDIFDYPLKKEEIYKFLVVDNFSKKDIFKTLLGPQKNVESKSGYFFLKGRKDLVAKRKEREKISLIKIKKAKKIVKQLTSIPIIKFIGISGALSMSNADFDDDIDIFVISENHLIWTTRFFLIIALKSLGVYRGRKDKEYSDKICLNFIIEEKKMSFEKNFYTAHEIIQLIPVFNKDKTYERFVSANSWVTKFLPNSLDSKKSILNKRKSFSDNFWIFIFRSLKIDKLFKYIQFNYMKRNIGKEVIKDGFLGFHPFDYKGFVLSKYSDKLKEYRVGKVKI